MPNSNSQFTKTELLLMRQIIANLSTYTTDDHYVEMLDDAASDGQPNLSDEIDALDTKIQTLI